jgi:hypothetical protein
VATTGKRSLATALACGLVGLVVAGCGGTAHPVPPKAASGWRRLCPEANSPALRNALAATLPLSLKATIVPYGASTTSVYASVYSASFSGVAALNPASGALTRIQAYPRPSQDQSDGVADGRFLVWKLIYSSSIMDDFDVYSYDAQTGKVRQIGRPVPGPGGQAWPGPWLPPVVSGHYAAWTRGSGPGGEAEVLLANLLTGRTRVIRRGHPEAPFFDGELVVWPESDRPGAPTTMHAVSAVTGRPASLPSVLTAVRGVWDIVSDGTRTAYVSPANTQLYYSPAQDHPARVILSLPNPQTFSDVQIAPGALVWTTNRATYLASTTTGGYAQVTPAFGGSAVGGPYAIIGDYGGKKMRPILPAHVIDVRQSTLMPPPRRC